MEAIDGRRALLAEGHVTEALYYFALARHLGVPFTASWPRAAEPVDVRDALAKRRVRMDGASPIWLLAPETTDIQTLLSVQSLALLPPDIAITTPGHFEAALFQSAPSQIARRAGQALPSLVPRLSACGMMSASTIAAILLGTLAVAGGILCGSHVESDVFGLVFLAGLFFRLLVLAAGATASSAKPNTTLTDRSLPTYSVLVPLRDEAEMVSDLVASLTALDYPRAKREVLFLIESEDHSTRAALLAQRLPAGFRIVDLPPGAPRTKPRALNAGLLLARGDLVTIYDAEDRPEPDQLRRAAGRFADAPASLACLQARLAITNGAAGLLPQLFAVEYAALFDVLNVGLARFGLPIPLGGTSNHFRAAALRAVGGWDAWNVTEDADLGLRLSRFGYAIDVLASTTFEEAPERVGLWFKQRRRWTKGWIQTLLVLLRDLPDVVRDLGVTRTLVVGLLLTNLVTGPLLTPIFAGFVVRRLVVEGITISHGFAALLETGLASAVIGIGMASALWQTWLGARRRALPLWTSILAALPYQLMISAAACLGFRDLLRQPHHWHKTPHGTAARRVRRPASASRPPA